MFYFYLIIFINIFLIDFIKELTICIFIRKFKLYYIILFRSFNLKMADQLNEEQIAEFK